jgi:hypothetical protein
MSGEKPAGATADRKDSVEPQKADLSAVRNYYEAVIAIGGRRATEAETKHLVELLNKCENQPHLSPTEGKQTLDRMIAAGAISIATKADPRDDEDDDDE